MMFPKDFYISGSTSVSDDCFIPDPVVLTSPGQVYRDALAFGTSPEMLANTIYDDDDATTIDPVCDLTVQKTDLVDKQYYRNHPEYTAPDGVNDLISSHSSSIPTAPSAGDSAGNSDSVQSSIPPVE